MCHPPPRFLPNLGGKSVSYSPKNTFVFFFFTSSAFGVKFTPFRPRPMSLVSMFSSMYFIVSGLIFKSLIYFELIFVYDVRQQSSFIVLHVALQFPQHRLTKKLLHSRRNHQQNRKAISRMGEGIFKCYP